LWRPLGNCPVAPPPKKKSGPALYGARGMRPLQLWTSWGPGVFAPPQPLQWLSFFFRRTLCEAYSASADLLAKCLREKETRVGKEMGETWVEQ